MRWKFGYRLMVSLAEEVEELGQSLVLMEDRFIDYRDKAVEASSYRKLGCVCFSHPCVLGAHNRAWNT